jgi:hypothetical protein
MKELLTTFVKKQNMIRKKRAESDTLEIKEDIPVIFTPKT